MRVKSEPILIGLLVAYFIFVAVAITVCTGCASTSEVQAPTSFVTEPEGRTIEQARDTAVSVETECGRGSGVLADGDHVLTAHHIVDCSRDEKSVRLAKTVKVRFTDGALYDVEYAALDPATDLALLRLPSTRENVPLFVVAPVQVNEVVCAFTSVPAREVHCGIIGATDAKPRAHGNLWIRGAQLWFGNSGSPLYNMSGQVVGIVTRTYFCDQIDALFYKWFDWRPDKMCGGRASGLDDVLP